MSPPRPVGFPRGRALLGDALLNRGTAFTHEERTRFGLHGLLPEAVETMETQLGRIRRKFDYEPEPLQQHIFLRALQDSNETLFDRFAADNIAEVLPIVYTPTVGEACREFSHIYRRPHGMFVSYPERDRMSEMFDNAATHEVEVVVVTDGERILGLGDQGVGGMGIPIGKLSLYTICGGIDPAATLPVMLDVGTDNPELLDDPLYMGWRHERIRGAEYDAFVDQFVETLRSRFPRVLLQWEDFAQGHAAPLLARYRDRICSFNDDIQGTAAVTLAALLAAVDATGGRLSDQTVCIVGAGSAGTGIAEQIIRAMVAEGLTEGEARSRFHLVDRHGLLHDRMADLIDIQRPLAQPWEKVRGWAGSRGGSGGPGDHGEISLLDTIRGARPGILIGVSGQGGIFTEEVVTAMGEVARRPIVFPLSNPTSRAEATPADVLSWTSGRAVVATGSPFAPVDIGGRRHVITQSNNVYVFPGLGAGVLAAGAPRVTDGMLIAAARRLADLAPENHSEGLLPPIDRVRDVSREVARAVALQAAEEGLTDLTPDELDASIARRWWEPAYRDLPRG